MLDELDKKIIRILQRNARVPNTEIGRALDVTETTIRNRVSRLIDEKLIEIVAVVDPKATDATISAFLRTEAQLAADGVHRLPADLGAAVAAFRADELMATVLGEDVHRVIADHKAAEWLEYNTVVSDWEREKYLQLW